MFGYPTGAWASYNSVSGCTVGIHGSANDDGSGHDGSGRYGHNTLTDNTHGLVVDDGSAIVARNTADGNDHTGIFTSVAGVRVQNNTANANGVYGIDAAAGTVDGGGNTATGNGTANCVNVSCP
jgi:hypothetical protein